MDYVPLSLNTSKKLQDTADLFHEVLLEILWNWNTIGYCNIKQTKYTVSV